MSSKDGVRNKPEELGPKDLRYKVYGKHKKREHLLLRKDRPIKDLVLDDSTIMKLEVIKAKLKTTRKYKTDDMTVMRSALKRYVNSHGFFMSRDLPDAINTIVIRLVDEAIGRVYSLPTHMERITVRPGDLSLLLQ